MSTSARRIFVSFLSGVVEGQHPAESPEWKLGQHAAPAGFDIDRRRGSAATATRAAVTAVDRTRFLLEHARARAAQANLSGEFVLEDIRHFSRPATFDLIINFFTSFGYFEDQADDLRMLELIRENLRPSWVFVLEMVSKERLAREFQATTSRELPNGDVLLERHEIVDEWTRVRNRWTLIRAGSTRAFEFTQSLEYATGCEELPSGPEVKRFAWPMC